MQETLVRTAKYGALPVQIYSSNNALGAAAARDAAQALKQVVAQRGAANLMVATGNSQLSFLQALGNDPSIPWPSITIFHMDEYKGIAADHSASFRRYIRENLARRVNAKAVHYIAGDAPDIEAEAQRYAHLLLANPIDVCACGIGENGHLAFNDPPVADFDDPLLVKVVELESACRQQQVNEGHFPTLDTVPSHALTVTVPGLLRARRILCIVPEARKAEPVRAALLGPISTSCPASILRRTPQAVLYLDTEAAQLL